MSIDECATLMVQEGYKRDDFEDFVETEQKLSFGLSASEFLSKFVEHAHNESLSSWRKECERVRRQNERAASEYEESMAAWARLLEDRAVQVEMGALRMED